MKRPNPETNDASRFTIVGRFTLRGLPPVRSLCRELAYSEKGNVVEAVYEW